MQDGQKLFTGGNCRQGTSVALPAAWVFTLELSDLGRQAMLVHQPKGAT
jgi:hypothetical protein